MAVVECIQKRRGKETKQKTFGPSAKNEAF